MSLENMISSDLETRGKVSAGTFAYLAERARGSCYDYIMRKFAKSGLTKAELARRSGKDPAQITRTLASPGNWTIATMAELLAVISEEEFLPSSASLKGRKRRNFTQADLLARLAAELPEPTEEISVIGERDTTGSTSSVVNVKIERTLAGANG